MQIRPYLIVPKLIPQPTWGGEYIASYKKIADPKILNQKIGQAYELSTDTMLSTVSESRDLPIEIGDPKTGVTLEVLGDTSTMFPLQDLINQDPKAVLGEKYLGTYGPKMQILIKFTQAKGNSFQVHVKPEKQLGHWLPKPESWFYFEPGKATLGLKPNADLEAYKQVCYEIEAFMKTQSQSKVDRQAIAEFLQRHDPFRFVNKVSVPKNAVIDLSSGGIHHSWEEGLDIPNGNILYEVQLNVMDNDCTIRSFDKGKIGDDGSIRPIHVADYFQALDTDPIHNDPQKLITQPNGAVIFDTPFYKTTFGFQDKNDSFQHVFVREGEFMGAKAGHSVFVPSAVAENGLTTSPELLVTQTGN